MNLQKIQSRINEFIEANQQDLMTTAEYLVYVSNLLFAISSPAIAIDTDLSIVDPKDYFSVESALFKYPDNPHLGCLIMAHKLLGISKRFGDD